MICYVSLVLKLILHIVLCQEENKNIIDIGDQNTIYIFASKGIQVAYFN